MKTSDVKTWAHELGADAVGIAAVETLSALPPPADVRALLPAAQSVIVVAHRILRGSLRGVEEGTNMASTFKTFGFEWSEGSFLAKTMYALACVLEDAGFDALPYSLSKASGGTFVPDPAAIVQAAGLGRIGKGGFILTPDYGHRQRFAMIVTDAKLDPDPIFTHPVCGDCRECARLCPLGALTPETTIRAGFPGFETDGFARDEALCSVCENGRLKCDRLDPDERSAAACGRACMAHQETRCAQPFQAPFRKRKIWSCDRDGVYSVSDPNTFKPEGQQA